MKWAFVASLVVASGCTFPGYETADDDEVGGAGGSGAGATTAGTGIAAGTGAGSASGGAAAAGPGNAGSGGTSASTAGTGGSGAMAGTATELAPIGIAGTWQLTFEDEFEGDTLDGAKWITYMLEGGNQFREWGGRAEWIADENVKLEDGDCVLTAEDKVSSGHDYTSGALNSSGLFEQEYGFFEARLRIPLGNGFWSVWALRNHDSWPPSIQGVEVLGGQPARSSFSYWFEGQNGAELVRHEAANDYTNGYHVYGIDWQQDHVAFYVDGTLIKSLADPDGRLSGPLYPSVNLSISTPESADPVPDETTPWPGEVRIDWIRVYQKLE
jgi:beta-glucanase (GH16 family)